MCKFKCEVYELWINKQNGQIEMYRWSIQDWTFRNQEPDKAFHKWIYVCPLFTNLVFSSLNFKDNCANDAIKYTCLMAPYSSTLAWKIPWMEEPGRLQSMGSQRVGHNWVTSLSLFTFIHWRRKWQPTPVFLPGESQGRGSLVGCRLWGCAESDTTEVT